VGTVGRALTEERLLGASTEGMVGRFDADEEHVPFDVFAGSGGAATWEGLIEQYKVGHLIDLCQKPVGKRTAAGSGNLIAQQLDRAIEDAVIVRFHKAILAMIRKPNHARVFDGRPEHPVGLQHRNHFGQMALAKPRDPLVLPGVSQASPSSFPQNLSFERGEDSQQSGHRSTGRRGQIQRLSQRHEPDAEMFRELSVAVRKSETVALRRLIMPVGYGFGGRVVRVNGGQL